MKIVITIGDFKVEISDNTDSAIKYNFVEIRQTITSVVSDYNSLNKQD
jgi:hypothetical protein